MRIKLKSWTPNDIKRILSDNLTEHKRTYIEHLSAAIAYQLKINLRYDTTTNRMYNDVHGCVERPTNPSECPIHDNANDVLVWEFSRDIWNSAGRLKRGFCA